MRTYLLFGFLVLLGTINSHKVTATSDPDIYLDDEGSGEPEPSVDLYPMGGAHSPPDDEDDEEELGSGIQPASDGGGGGGGGGSVGYWEDDDDFYKEGDDDFYKEGDDSYDDDGDRYPLEGSGYHPTFDTERTRYEDHVYGGKGPIIESPVDEDPILEEKYRPTFEESPEHMPSTTPPPTLTDNQTGMDHTVRILTQKEDERQLSIFAQPDILAAFIGGAVTGLLFAILLVMFIVYRMRKRDEGSYPLDEPKRVPLTSSYSPNDKEIFA